MPQLSMVTKSHESSSRDLRFSSRSVSDYYGFGLGLGLGGASIQVTALQAANTTISGLRYLTPYHLDTLTLMVRGQRAAFQDSGLGLRAQGVAFADKWLVPLQQAKSKIDLKCDCALHDLG